jgi:hypothetical protein
MKIRPIELKVANRYIIENHRHHKQVQGHKFSIGLFIEDKLIGILCCGRPVSRHLDNGFVLEVTRLCTDGTKNACSKLYSSAARIAKELGYDKIITYILESESGNSLIATGWICESKVCGGLKWKRNDGQRTDTITDLFGSVKKYPNEKKQRWVKILCKDKK